MYFLFFSSNSEMWALDANDEFNPNALYAAEHS